MALAFYLQAVEPESFTHHRYEPHYFYQSILTFVPEVLTVCEAIQSYFTGGYKTKILGK
jgi:hypothetical protein